MRKKKFDMSSVDTQQSIFCNTARVFPTKFLVDIMLPTQCVSTLNKNTSDRKPQKQKNTNFQKQQSISNQILQVNSRQMLLSSQYKKIQINGKIVETNFHKLNIDGFVKIYYNTGQQFQGIFHQGNKVKGTFKFTDGLQYSGSFQSNLFHGQGTLKDKSGREIIAKWAYGKIVGSAVIKVNQRIQKNMETENYFQKITMNILDSLKMGIYKDMIIAQGFWEKGILRPNQDPMTKMLQSLTIVILYPPETVTY